MTGVPNIYMSKACLKWHIFDATVLFLSLVRRKLGGQKLIGWKLRGQTLLGAFTFFYFYFYYF